MNKDLKYVALEKVKIDRPVRKIPWIVNRVKGKIVLDLGAYDETALNKITGDFWLHKRISETAKEVIGVDNSEKLPRSGLRTSPKSIIYKGDVFDLGKIVGNQKVDVIVAGELIEHLPDTLRFLNLIKQNPIFFKKELIITTPNAVSIHNILLGVFSRESTHQDHLQIYSYKTLNTLCLRVNFKEWEIIPYKVLFGEMIMESKGVKRILVKILQYLINSLEYLFPILSAGWIVRIKI